MDLLFLDFGDESTDGCLDIGFSTGADQVVVIVLYLLVEQLQQNTSSSS